MKFAFLISCFFFIRLGNGQVSFERNFLESIPTEITYGTIVKTGLGPGISFVDYDNDGWDDITLPASGNRDFQFLKNMGGFFELQQLPISSNGLQTRQTTWVDFDNDGDNDFFATSESGQCWFMENIGNGAFIDILETSGLPTMEIPYWGASWGDYNNDGFLDIFISVRDPLQEKYNLLYHNNGDGTFTDITQQAGLHTSGFITFCASFFDYNNDGFQDIYMANDKCITPNILYRNNGDGTFDDVSEQAGVNVYMSAMSTTIDDYNNDGWLDIYVTNFYPPFEENATVGNAFLINNKNGTFSNIALENGTRFDSIGWGAAFFDADNDTDTDLYVSGSLDGMGERISAAFYENDGEGGFTVPEDSGLQNDIEISFGNAIGDIQNDGLVDIVVVNTNDLPISVWENKTNTEHNWLKVKLEGTVSNRMGIGSFIKIGLGNGDAILHRYTLCGEGYISQNSTSEFFGIGDAEVIDYVEVTWLSGIKDRIENITGNQLLYIVEGSYPVGDTEEEETLDEIIGDDEAASEEEETQVTTDTDANNDAIRAYLNPNTNLLTINRISANSTLEVYDYIGKFIQKYQGIEPMDLSGFNSGLYFIKMTTNKEVTPIKLVVSK